MCIRDRCVRGRQLLLTRLSGSIFCTRNICQQIYGKNLSTEERYERAKDMFLFGCFTGLSYIDIKTLAPEHFEKNNTGRIWIKKRRVKTGVLSRIPLLPIAKLILDRYTGGEKLLPIQDPADRKGVINETYHWWLL